MKTSYVNNIMVTVTQKIMNQANKQACKDFPKGRVSSSKKQAAKWKHIFKLCDYQCRALTGKRGKRIN